MSRAIRVSLALGLVYVLTLASTDPVDMATGVLLGALLVALLHDKLRLGPKGVLPSLASRALWLPVFIGAVFADVARGSWQVTSHVLHLRPLQRPGIVRIPLGDRTDRGVAVSALASTLSPGSVLIEIDWERRDMLMHFIDASDPEAVRADLQRFYDRYQRRVFP
jgi:multicomponent K+:H+ antiporter subunit E/multicomponent Na+:H+ antiporter subunit E